MSYDELDAAILQAIKDGKQKFFLIRAAVDELARPHSLRGDSFRVVDRRLQALRNKRLITYWTGKWRIANDR